MVFVIFSIVVAIYYYMSVHVGFWGGGFNVDFTKTQGEFVKALGFLFNGISAVTVFLSFNNYERNNHYYKLLSIAMIITVILFTVFMHNRRLAIYFVVICMLLIQIVSETKFIKTAIIMVLPIIFIYFATTAVRLALPSRYDAAGASFIDKLSFSKELLVTDVAQRNVIEDAASWTWATV